jgi:tRNA(Glu) U13 pseudouridine synthase TruD
VNIEEIKSACKKFTVEGHPRNSLFSPKNFKFEIKRNHITLNFDLGIGEYASLVLDFLFNNQLKTTEKLN